MASKRPFPQEEGESSRSLAKRISLWNVYYGDVTNFAEGLSVRLEPLLRGVLREEIPRVILNCENSNTRPSINQVHGAIRFRLQFRNRLSHNLFTNRGILSEHKTPIELAIVDTNSNETVTSEPWASLEVKIVAVRGDFNRDGCTTWSREEFESHVESERDGQKPLLTGKINVRLSNGVGVIHDACFTDISRWTRSGMFRLGAEISDGRYNGERVQEAITEAVKVKDARVEMNQKDSPPSLNDEVFCLKNIQKGGPFHQKLKAYGINTVQDFLRSYVMDHNKLRTLQWVKVNGSDLHQINLPPYLKVRLNNYKKLAYENQGDILELREPPRENLDLDLIQGPSFCNPYLHNSDLLTTFHDASTNQMDSQGQAYDPCNASSCNITQPSFNQLHQYNILQKLNSGDRCNNLLIPGQSSFQALDDGTAHQGEKVQNAGRQLVSTSRHDAILIQGSASFSMEIMSSDPKDDQQNQQSQCTNFFDNISGEEWEDWIQSPGVETPPLSSCKWVQLVAVFKFVSAIKRSTCRRFTACFKTSKFSLEGMDQTNAFIEDG